MKNSDVMNNQGCQVLRAFGHEVVSSEQTGGTSCVLRMFASPGNDVPLQRTILKTRFSWWNPVS
ncbi:MAG: hypothetical protein JO170_21490 [Verrucomicrobia bacterium]|nr:hypothetical protein [Verrucomicrobiota bacterium]